MCSHFCQLSWQNPKYICPSSFLCNNVIKALFFCINIILELHNLDAKKLFKVLMLRNLDNFKISFDKINFDKQPHTRYINANFWGAHWSIHFTKIDWFVNLEIFHLLYSAARGTAHLVGTWVKFKTISINDLNSLTKIMPLSNPFMYLSISLWDCACPW